MSSSSCCTYPPAKRHVTSIASELLNSSFQATVIFVILRVSVQEQPQHVLRYGESNQQDEHAELAPSNTLRVGQKVEAKSADGHRHEVLPLYLRHHCENHLHNEAEVGETTPRHLTVAHLRSEFLGSFIKLFLVHLFLIVPLCVAFPLLVHVFSVLLVQLLLCLGCHDLQESERRGHVLQVNFDRLIFFNVVVYPLLPLKLQ